MTTYLDLLDPPCPPETRGDTFSGADASAPGFDRLARYVEEHDRLIRVRWDLLDEYRIVRGLPRHAWLGNDVQQALDAHPLLVGWSEYASSRRSARALARMRHRVRAPVAKIRAEQLPCEWVLRWLQQSNEWRGALRSDLRHGLDIDLARYRVGEERVLQCSNGMVAVGPPMAIFLSSYQDRRHPLTCAPLEGRLLDDGDLLVDNDWKSYMRSSVLVVRNGRPVIVRLPDLSPIQNDWIYTFLQRVSWDIDAKKSHDLGPEDEELVVFERTGQGWLDGPNIWQAALDSGWPSVAFADRRVYLAAIRDQRLSPRFVFLNVDLHLRQRCVRAPDDDIIRDEMQRLQRALHLDAHPDVSRDEPSPDDAALRGALEKTREDVGLTRDVGGLELGSLSE